jgi:hypothetical protein
MDDRLLPRALAVCLAALAVVGSVLFVDAPHAEAAASFAVAGCRSFPAYSEANHGVLVPGSMPLADPAIIEGDPDAEDMPMASVRYPDEASLWAASGTRGSALVAAATETASQTGALADLGPQRTDRAVSDSIVRLYCGLLGREPDALEVEYWARRYWNGLPLATIAAAFTTSTEFIDRHGDPSDEALIPILYRSVLGRESGEGGVGPFVEMLQDGAVTRGSLVVTFTD